VDRIYARWQSVHPNLDYDGDKSRTLDMLGLLNTPLNQPRVYDVLHTTDGPLCYGYSNSVRVDNQGRRVNTFLQTDGIVCPAAMSPEWIAQHNFTDSQIGDIRTQETSDCAFMKFAAVKNVIKNN
jgi:hypothetical protein